MISCAALYIVFYAISVVSCFCLYIYKLKKYIRLSTIDYVKSALCSIFMFGWVMLLLDEV